VLLPPNSTHLTQKLAVAYFRPLKQAWRKNLLDWKKRNRGTLPESLFPVQLNKTLNSLENSKTNAISGFRACGIISLDRNRILKRLPDSKIKHNKEVWSTTFEETLRVAREAQPIRQRYGTCYHSVLEAVYRLCNLNDDTGEFGKPSLPLVLRSAITILVKALSNSYSTLEY
jgi:hypothetical protein